MVPSGACAVTCSLVVRTIHLGFYASRDFGQPAGAIQRCAMNRVVGRFRGNVMFGVRDGRVRLLTQVLDQSAPQIDVQKLATVADGQNGFLLAESVFQDGTIRRLARRVRRRRLAAIDRAVFSGRHIGGTARQNEGIQGRQFLLKLARIRQGEQHRLASRGADGILVIFDLGAILFRLFRGRSPGNAYAGPLYCLGEHVEPLNPSIPARRAATRGVCGQAKLDWCR